MNKLIIPVQKNNSTLNYEVMDYPHGEGDTCKFEVYLQNKFVASLQPDSHGHLHVCKNPGKIEDNTLHIISDEIEKYNW